MTRIVLDADWFVIGETKFLKRLAFAYVDLPISDEFTFSLPKFAHKHSKDLAKQARYSHGLAWQERGKYTPDETAKVFKILLERIGKPESGIEFYAKGLEKSNFLEKFLEEVRDLDNFGCPKYSSLTLVPQTTLSKAVTFAQWLANGSDHFECCGGCESELSSGSSEDQ